MSSTRTIIAKGVFTLHINTATNLHRAQLHLIQVDKKIAKLTAELEEAKADRSNALDEVDKKRKAAVHAESVFFNDVSKSTRYWHDKRRSLVARFSAT